MEQATLIQMARLRTMAARKGKPFDVARFASDREFSKHTLKTLLDTEDEELIVAGLQMMEALKMTVPTHSTSKASEAALQPLSPKPPEASKYIGRLR